MRKPRGRSRGSGPSTPAGAALAVPNVENITIGIPNITRNFRLDYASTPDRFGTPSYFLQKCRPYAAFLQGWTQAASGSSDPGGNQDLASLGAILSTDDSDIDKVLFAQTQYGMYWQEAIWPVMLSIFEAGVGERFDAKQNRVLRYFAHAAYAYMLAYQAFVLNRLTYGFDWTPVAPGSNIVPPSMYALSRDYPATNPDMESKWMELLARVQDNVLPPDWVQQIKRSLTPFLTVGLGPKLVWPVSNYAQYQPWQWTTAGKTPLELCEASLDFIDGALHKTKNMIRSFLPFPISLSDPFSVGGSLVDYSRWNGMRNAGLRDTPIYGHKSSLDFPAVDEGMRWYKDDNNLWSNVHYYSALPVASWGEMQFANVFAVDATPTIGNDFQLVTPHQYNGFVAFGDNYKSSDNKTWLSTDVGDDVTDDAARYYKCFPCARWNFADYNNVAGGFLLGESVVTEVSYEAAIRTLRLTVEQEWNYDIMRTINKLGDGQSLREIRTIFAEMATGAAVAARARALQ